MSSLSTTRPTVLNRNEVSQGRGNDLAVGKLWELKKLQVKGVEL